MAFKAPSGRMIAWIAVISFATSVAVSYFPRLRAFMKTNGAA